MTPLFAHIFKETWEENGLTYLGYPGMPCDGKFFPIASVEFNGTVTLAMSRSEYKSISRKWTSICGHKCQPFRVRENRSAINI